MRWRYFCFCGLCSAMVRTALTKQRNLPRVFLIRSSCLFLIELTSVLSSTRNTRSPPLEKTAKSTLDDWLFLPLIPAVRWWIGNSGITSSVLESMLNLRPITVGSVKPNNTSTMLFQPVLGQMPPAVKLTEYRLKRVGHVVLRFAYFLDRLDLRTPESITTTATGTCAPGRQAAAPGRRSSSAARRLGGSSTGRRTAR